MTSLDKINFLFDRFEQNTEGSFHNSLWQIIINQPNRKNAAWVFIPVPGPGKVNVGIVDEGQSGYTPATFSVKGSLTEDEIYEMFAVLNEVTFGITQQRAEEIELQSYKQ